MVSVLRMNFLFVLLFYCVGFISNTEIKTKPRKEKKRNFNDKVHFFSFFYINQDITSRVEIEMSEEIIVEDPAPMIGSTCVSSAMVPKITKSN